MFTLMIIEKIIFKMPLEQIKGKPPFILTNSLLLNNSVKGISLKSEYTDSLQSCIVLSMKNFRIINKV